MMAMFPGMPQAPYGGGAPPAPMSAPYGGIAPTAAMGYGTAGMPPKWPAPQQPQQPPPDDTQPPPVFPPPPAGGQPQQGANLGMMGLGMRMMNPGPQGAAPPGGAYGLS